MQLDQRVTLLMSRDSSEHVPSHSAKGVSVHRPFLLETSAVFSRPGIQDPSCSKFQIPFIGIS